MSARSARLSVLLSRDTLVGAVVVALAMAICVGLGLWQYGRFEDRRDIAQTVESNYQADPVTLESVLPAPDSPLTGSEDWTPVQLEGSYCTDPDCILYVRNRTLGATVGFWQLAPFQTDDGATLLVVRGWVDSDAQESEPADPPAVPEGELTITARLRPAEGVISGRENPEGQVHSVSPEQIAPQLPELSGPLTTGAYGELAAEDPAGPRPQDLPAPDTSLGPHLSYAFQWWIFALFFPGALIFRTHKVMQEEIEDQDEGGTGPKGTPRPRPRARARRRSRDEEDEDALIDRQHT